MPRRDETLSPVETTMCIACRLAHTNSPHQLFHRELPAYWRLLNELVMAEREAGRITGLWIGNEVDQVLMPRTPGWFYDETRRFEL